MRTHILACLFVTVVPAASAADKLTVYTYDSFVAEWGPGPKIEKAFEAVCACDVEFLAVADGAALLNRLELEGTATRADIILGLDTNRMAEARSTGLFSPHGVTGALTVPGGWQDDMFLPYDYSYLSVVYNRDLVGTPPTSLQELVDGNAEQKIVIQDPRSSSPGLGFLLWMKAVYGDKAPDAWAKLRKRVLTVTPGWSESYALFTKGEAAMVISHMTSPAYHIIMDKTEKFQATSFSEGNYLQVEIAGITTPGASNPLARKFMTFMVSPAFQDIIPESNWMFPAAATTKPLAAPFEDLPKPAKTLLLSPEEVAGKRKAWVDEWLSVMSQ